MGGGGGLVRVYHGTTAAALRGIMVRGLRPAPGRACVYVTTDRRRAEQYAQTWALHFLRDHDDDGGGAVLSMSLPRAALQPDPDDVVRAGQFTVRGGVRPGRFLEHALYSCDFSEPYWDEIAAHFRNRIGRGGYICPAGCPPTIRPVQMWPWCAAREHATRHALVSAVHGPAHWHRVAAAGLRLAQRTPAADREVVIRFAVWHDSRRLDDGADAGHGERAAALVAGLDHGLERRRHEQLVAAIAGHEHGAVTEDPVVGTCWDSDRLDLWRLGRRPDPELLSTAAARDPVTIEWARGRQKLPADDWAELADAYWPTIRQAVADADRRARIYRPRLQ